MIFVVDPHDCALQAAFQTGAEIGDLQRLRDFAEELWRWDRSDRSLKPTERCFKISWECEHHFKPTVSWNISTT